MLLPKPVDDFVKDEDSEDELVGVLVEVGVNEEETVMLPLGGPVPLAAIVAKWEDE